jgi:hypothetical protein
MSTPDKTSSSAPERTTAGGVNAYKINRTKMALPEKEPLDAEEVRPSVPFKPAAFRFGPRKWLRRAAYAAAGVVVAGAVGGLLWSVAGKGGAGNEGDEQIMVPPPRTVTLPSYRALVIGINQYAQTGGAGWAKLNSARADAESIAKTLSDDYGFHVQTLLDGEATRSAILTALDELATSGEDGADLIYFAGHGFFDDKLQEGYWIPSDARKTVDGRQAKEDWLWNSTITRLIGASRARHVLVMSDACYGGSLFRGDEPLTARGGKTWYERAISIPSRYLITSGGLEPVLDSGAGHSVFAQQVINYLKHSEQTIFSANDLGLALCDRVSALTGQMVQMGPLPVSGHAGGQFVFVRQKNGVQLATLSPQVEPIGGTERGGGEIAETGSRQDTIRDAVALTRAGAPKAANSLVAGLLQQNAQDPLARAVADYIARCARQEGREELRKLIDQVEAKGKATGAVSGGKAAVARPRVLACLGPVLATGGDPSAESVALLYRILLRSELEAKGGIKVIEREALETILQEQNVGVSDLADSRARLMIGKLLPASLLLLGDLVPLEQGEKIFVRLVDTETTQVLSSFTVSRKGDEDQEKVCGELAEKIIERITMLKPLLATVSSAEDTHLRAGLGTYHGVREGIAFNVLSRTLRDKKTPDDFVEKELGTATVRNVSDYSCELDAVWLAGGAPRLQDLWIRERPMTAAEKRALTTQ